MAGKVLELFEAWQAMVGDRWVRVGSRLFPAAEIEVFDESETGEPAALVWEMPFENSFTLRVSLQLHGDTRFAEMWGWCGDPERMYHPDLVDDRWVATSLSTAFPRLPPGALDLDDDDYELLAATLDSSPAAFGVELAEICAFVSKLDPGAAGTGRFDLVA